VVAAAASASGCRDWTLSTFVATLTEVDDSLRVRLTSLLANDARSAWAYLFGSAARGEKHRDVDIAVMPEDGTLVSLTELGRLQIELSRAAGTDVDLVDLRRAPLPLLGSILRERIVLVDRRRHERHDWEARTHSRWLDFEPALRRSSAIRREKLALRSGIAR
jgi:predicted nucleotidyltransferase